MSGATLSSAKGPAKWAAAGALSAAAVCALAWSIASRPRTTIRELPPRIEQPHSMSADMPRSVTNAPVTVLRDPPAIMTGSTERSMTGSAGSPAQPPGVIEIHVIDNRRFGPLVDEGAAPGTTQVVDEQPSLAPPVPIPRDAPTVAPAAVSKPVTAKTPSPGSRINVNTATRAELELLPGVGPAIASRIIEERQKQRFQSVDDLDRVKGIGPKILERLRPFVTVEAPAKPR